MKRLLHRAIETVLPTQATEPRATPLRTWTCVLCPTQSTLYLDSARGSSTTPRKPFCSRASLLSSHLASACYS